jgi:uncharacterized protein YuzE
MKVNYDQGSDTLTIILRDDVAIAESEEDRPGVVLDYDADGGLVSVEILQASRVTDARRIEYEATESDL